MVKCPHLASPFLTFSERTLWEISTFGNLFQKYKIVSMMPPNLLYSTTSFISEGNVKLRVTGDYFTVTMFFQPEACRL